MENTNSRERLGSVALMMMTFSAVFAFPSIINNSIQIGLATIPAYIFGSVFYFLPFILMIAEFSSANSEKESGVHSWLECVLGPKWAFLGAWAYFFVNLFYFCSLLPQTLIYASYAFVGKNVFGGANGTKVIAIISILLFWLATYVCVKGVSWISKVTSFAGSARLFMGIAFVLLAFVVVFGFGKAPAQEFSMQTITPKFNWTFFMTMAWVLQAVGGGESIGVYVKDVKGGNKTFVKVMVMSTVFVGIMYVLGAVAVGLIVPGEVLSGNFSNGIFDVFQILGGHFGIPKGVIVRLVGVILLLGNLGSLALWMKQSVTQSRISLKPVLPKSSNMKLVRASWMIFCVIINRLPHCRKRKKILSVAFPQRAVPWRALQGCSSRSSAKALCNCSHSHCLARQMTFLPPQRLTIKESVT